MVMSGRSEDEHEDDESLGVLDDAGAIDTTTIGITGGTAQVSVSLPVVGDDDDDDDVVDDDAEIAEFLAELAEREADAAEPESDAAADAREDQDQTSAEDERSAAEDVVTAEPVEDVAVSAEEPEPYIETAEEASDAASDLIEFALIDDAPTASPAPVEEPVPADEPVIAEEVEHTMTAAPEPHEAAAAVAATAAPRAEVALTSKRLGDLGEASRESADLLTSDRLVDPVRRVKPEPEGAWAHFLYAASGHLINIGDGKRARERKALSARIAANLSGGARFVAVLSRKGGVGKTTVTALLGMALADAREDRVVAVDANPDRGTLADRIAHQGTKSVRDLARVREQVRGYQDISAMVGRDATRLDVLSSDADPHVAEAFSDVDYRSVADVAAHYYSLVLTDTGTGIVHSVMRETLDLADQLVIVAGLSVDEARLASETLTWLESNGRADLAREAIVVLNKAMPGKSLVQDTDLEKHFASRVRHVVRMPYDPQIATGGEITFADLQPQTRQAARELAALVVESLRSRAA